MDLSKVYHVGFLDVSNLNNRPVVYSSLEGTGLSVSLCPEEWIKIAKLGGKNTYLLSKEGARFYMAHEGGNSEALEWCVENGYLSRANKYRAYRTDEEGEEIYFEMDSEQEASDESEDVRLHNGYKFAEKGKAYWQSSFSSLPKNSFAEDFAVIFWAEAMGFDGVWWNDTLDSSILSAPRGVIFQARLSEWKIEEV